jgi:uncharacterized RDD family membrane protein YckC
VKCPKCGYVGFEHTGRCRHCGYDFSFTAVAEPPPAAAASVTARSATTSVADEFFAADRADGGASLDQLGFVDLPKREPAEAGPLVDLPLAVPAPSSDLFDDSPPPARPPLAVRRAPERPRSRPTTQVVRRTPTSLLDVSIPAEAPAQTASPAPSVASIAARLGAGLLDLAILGGIATIVVYFTVRLSGLTMAEVDVLPKLPLGAYLLGLAAAYLAAFTACGGQTLGKMALGVRVVADDGAVPPGAAALRTIAALIGAALGGLGFLPALFDADRRGVHDRVAGTRVVRV